MASLVKPFAVGVLVIACALLIGLAMYAAYYFSIGRLIASFFDAGDRSLWHLVLHIAGFVLVYIAIGYLGMAVWRRYGLGGS
ncbi:hypothetical protein ABFT80_14450 [Mesorhizobium sp. SB112]|uniref:hypothetical protein n=1 Tax=Mesorhizobium sp. SB112 TaxID=3151853 RepID=UPI003265DB55